MDAEERGGVSRRGVGVAGGLGVAPQAVPTHVSSDTADILLRKARDGGADAFMELIAPHRPHLESPIYRLLDDAGEMPDVLQEVYLSAYRALPKYRGDADLGTWLHRIAYNACLRYRSRRPQIGEPGHDREPTASDHADEAAERLDVAAALAGLPLDQRALVLLVDCHGLQYQAAAEVLGIPLGTVSSRLASARAKLRRALTPDSDGGEA